MPIFNPIMYPTPINAGDKSQPNPIIDVLILKIYSIDEFQIPNACWEYFINAPIIVECKIVCPSFLLSIDFNIFDVAIPSGNFNFFSIINVFLRGIVNIAPRIPPISAIFETSR